MGIHLHYRESGRGEVLILLHGNGEDSSYFFHQMKYFSKKYRVIGIDTRGHGNSPRGLEPFCLQQFREDLRNFMDEQHICQANILGFSDGANTALLFALKYPHRVRRLILNGGNLYPQGIRRHVQLPIEISYGILSIFPGKSQKRQHERELLGLMVNEPDIYPQRLRRLRMPVLVIAGTRDMVKASHTRMIFENLPNGRLVFVRGSHFVARENPKAFNKIVEEFLQRT